MRAPLFEKISMLFSTPGDGRFFPAPSPHEPLTAHGIAQNQPQSQIWKRGSRRALESFGNRPRLPVFFPLHQSLDCALIPKNRPLSLPDGKVSPEKGGGYCTEHLVTQECSPRPTPMVCFQLATAVSGPSSSSVARDNFVTFFDKGRSRPCCSPSWKLSSSSKLKGT